MSDDCTDTGCRAGSRRALAATAGEKPKLSFVKDIVPIFTKSGCANSNCHGSIRGQAGFKLSLFGYEPDLDYDAIVKAQDGRRINRTDPAKSLILMKPTFSIPHGGGRALQGGIARVRGDSGLDSRMAQPTTAPDRRG